MTSKRDESHESSTIKAKAPWTTPEVAEYVPEVVTESSFRSRGADGGVYS
jgi:hypothetical protein